MKPRARSPRNVAYERRRRLRRHEARPSKRGRRVALTPLLELHWTTQKPARDNSHESALSKWIGSGELCGSSSESYRGGNSEVADERRGFDNDRPRQVTSMSPLALAVDIADDSVDPEPVAADVVLKNVAPFPTHMRALPLAAANRLNKHDRVVVGAFP